MLLVHYRHSYNKYISNTRRHTYRIKTLMEKHHHKPQHFSVQCHITSDAFYERICQQFGQNIVLQVENQHGNFSIEIQPSKKQLEESQSTRIFEFLKRWRCEEKFITLILLEDSIHQYKTKDVHWKIPLGVSFFIKDPSNGF